MVPYLVLILASDTAIATLLATMVQLARHRPALPRDDEHHLGAIERVRPKLILLDCDHAAATETSTYECARAIGSTVLLFSAARAQWQAEEFARRRGLGAFALPIRFGEFTEHLARALPS